MATGYLHFGTRLYADLAGGSTYAELADMKEIGSPGEPEYPDVDMTALYEAVAIRKFRAGLLNQGEFTFKQFWTKARWTSLKTPFAAKTDVAWRITYPDNATPANATKDEFPGYIKKLVKEPATEPDQPAMIVVTVKINGAITNTEGS